MKKKLRLNKKTIYPVSIPYISQRDINSVNKVLKNGWISSDGPEVRKFESEFSKFIGRKYSVTVSSGTAALEIAIKALGIKKNDEVLIPNFTIISNALAVVKQQAKPVLVDCNLENWNIDINQLENKINKKTKAIIVTHIYSFANDMDKILKICRKNSIFVIEDAAEVIGLKYKNKKCGSFGDISTFSFYANKQITTGEGGMISVNKFDLYNKCKSLRNLCFGKLNRFNHEDIGWNYRMTNIQAALGLSQIKNINKIVKKKIMIGRQYYKNLKLNKNLTILPPFISYSKNIYWVVGILIKNKKIKSSLLAIELRKFGIMTRPFFWPMHEQPVLKKYGIYDNSSFPVAERIGRKGFYIPSGLALTDADMKHVSEAIHSIIN